MPKNLWTYADHFLATTSFATTTTPSPVIFYSFNLNTYTHSGSSITTLYSGTELCNRVGGHATLPHPPHFENFLKIYNYFNVFKIQSTKIRIGPPKYLNLSNDALKKNNWSNSYRDITFFFFAILFFIVKCALMFTKYLIKFDTKHV